MTSAIAKADVRVGQTLGATYRGAEYTCEVIDHGGHLGFQLPSGEVFKSPSAAGKAITGTATNGYRFWSVSQEAPAGQPQPPVPRPVVDDDEDVTTFIEGSNTEAGAKHRCKTARRYTAGVFFQNTRLLQDGDPYSGQRAYHQLHCHKCDEALGIYYDDHANGRTTDYSRARWDTKQKTFVFPNGMLSGVIGS